MRRYHYKQSNFIYSGNVRLTLLMSMTSLSLSASCSIFQAASADIYWIPRF